MEFLHQQLVETWRINQRMMLLVIDKVTQAGLDCTLSARGGRTIGQQLVHVHNVRRNWLEVARKDLLKGVEVLDREQGGDRGALRSAFVASGEAIEQLIASTTDGKVKSWKSGLVPFVGYMLAHEAHHRGGILLTLKACKQTFDKDAGWQLWEWGKP